jgi:N-acetylglutamate synthase-like GNAT family acetyltransferase
MERFKELGLLGLRAAEESDIPFVSEMTKGNESLLARNEEELGDLIQDFHILWDDCGGETKVRIGCVGAKRYSRKAEIISLILDTTYQRDGIGTVMARHQLAYLQSLPEVEEIFCLTNEKLAERIFIPLGFKNVVARYFVGKIVEDCARCEKNKVARDEETGRIVSLCDEVALIFSPEPQIENW